MNRLPLLVALLLFAADSAAGQDPSDSVAVVVAAPSTDTVDVSNVIYVNISTNADDAILFADSVSIGAVPSGYFPVHADTERLRLTVDDAGRWSVPPIEVRLNAAAGDSVDVDLHFPYHYSIESIPFGANVHVERGEEWDDLGTTPLLHASDAPLDGMIVIERPGYSIQRVEPGSDIWNRHVIMLKPSDDLDPTAAQVSWQPPKKRRVWIDYAALGTAVAAGVVAVHYKFKADDLYSEYEITADPALRDNIHAHDRRSGVAFGVMQAGLGLFAIRLVLR